MFGLVEPVTSYMHKLITMTVDQKKVLQVTQNMTNKQYLQKRIPSPSGRRPMYSDVQVSRKAGEDEIGKWSRGWPGPYREQPG